MSGEEHIAYADKAAELLARMTEVPYPETHVKVIDGVVGVIQHEYQDLESDLGDRSLGSLNKTELGQVQLHHAFDWLIGNHNTQGADLQLRKTGTMLGMAKEPFRFYGEDSLDIKYNPYPEQISYYNFWFGEYASGALGKGVRLDADAKPLAKFLDAVDSMGDEDFVALLKMYSTRAKAAKKGWSEMKFLNSALERKRTLRRTMKRFYDKLERQRRATS